MLGQPRRLGQIRGLGQAGRDSLVRSELQAITGRRGFLAALLGPVIAVAAVGTVRLVLHAVDPVRWPSIGGIVATAVAGNLVTFVVVVTGVVTGALAGSDQTPTGAGRLRKYLARMPALLGVYLTSVALAATACAMLAALPHEYDTRVTVGWVAWQAWSVLVPTAVYGLLGLAVGSLARSAFSAVVISLLLSVAAAPVLLTVSTWSQRLSQLLLPGAVARLSHPGRAAASSLTLAVVVVLVWLAVPLVAGGLRLYRSDLYTDL